MHCGHRRDASSRSSPARLVVALALPRTDAARRCAPPSTVCARKRSRCSTTRTTRCAEATNEVDRIDRLVGSAERINDAVDGAQRMAYKTLASPVVKAMAFGTGRLPCGAPPPRGRAPGADPGRAARSRAAGSGCRRCSSACSGSSSGSRSGSARPGRSRASSAAWRPRYAPTEVADRWSGTMRAAVDEGRAAMRSREAELKDEHGARGRAVA